MALISEMLAANIEETGHKWGLTQVFLGVIVVAIVGNAAEHSSAILMAMKNKMDLAVGIAMGSALQIALFVAPVLVFASLLARSSDGPLLHDAGGRRRADGGDDRPHGGRGRRVELARRRDAANDLRDSGRGLLRPARAGLGGDSRLRSGFDRDSRRDGAGACRENLASFAQSSSIPRAAVPPLVKWTGGKRSQAARIAAIAPSHQRYIEPFLGGGAVLYHLAHRGRSRPISMLP